MRRAILVALLVAGAIPLLGPHRIAEAKAAVCPPVTLGDLEAEEEEEEEEEPDEPEIIGGVDVDSPGVTAPPSTTTTTVPEPTCDVPFVYPLVFPVLGGSGVGSPFGAARDGGARLHAGNDLFGTHLQPIVAAASGTITRLSADDGISGYRIGITHDDGWSTLYIHLNNDTAGTDDGSGVGIRQDLRVGDRVEAGELIGWNGDSGNAEGTIHHLHFELHDPAGTPVDPEASLDAAIRTADDLNLEDAVDGPFVDMAPSGQPGAITRLLSEGVPMWCDDTRVRACPDAPATAADVASWLATILDPPLAPHVDDAPRPKTPDPATYFPDAVCDDCDEPPALTELDIARVVVWDMLQRAFEASRSYRAEAGTPDGSWTTPVGVPPDDPSALTTGRVLEVLGNTGLCPVIDPTTPLTRRQAAEFVAVGVWAQCPSSARASAATR